MTGDKKWFSSLTPVKEKMYITFGENGRGRVISEGVVHVSDKVTLKRVALVKSLGLNLLSVATTAHHTLSYMGKVEIPKHEELTCRLGSVHDRGRGYSYRSNNSAECVHLYPSRNGTRLVYG
jgi:hypothetical protein